MPSGYQLKIQTRRFNLTFYTILFSCYMINTGLMRNMQMDKEQQNAENSDEKQKAGTQDTTTAPVTDKSVWDYFILCITEKYFCFKGRARRKEYWSFVLFNILIGLVLEFVGDFLRLNEGNTTGIDLLNRLISIALFVPGFAVLFRRLHDVNFSGWWITAPFIGFIVLGIIAGFQNAVSALYGVRADYSMMKFMTSVLSVVFVIPMLVVFALIFFKSDMKENKYGPIPQGVE